MLKFVRLPLLNRHAPRLGRELHCSQSLRRLRSSCWADGVPSPLFSPFLTSLSPLLPYPLPSPIASRFTSYLLFVPSSRAWLVLVGCACLWSVRTHSGHTFSFYPPISSLSFSPSLPVSFFLPPLPLSLSLSLVSTRHSTGRRNTHSHMRLNSYIHSLTHKPRSYSTQNQGRAGKKGTAITFVTPEEERFAPDLVAGLEASKGTVPQDLKKVPPPFFVV